MGRCAVWSLRNNVLFSKVNNYTHVYVAEAMTISGNLHQILYSSINTDQPTISRTPPTRFSTVRSRDRPGGHNIEEMRTYAMELNSSRCNKPIELRLAFVTRTHQYPSVCGSSNYGGATRTAIGRSLSTNYDSTQRVSTSRLDSAM